MKFKNYFYKILFQFLAFILIFLKGFKSLELCKQYSIGSLLFNSFYCIDYCCGNCNFRYCCANETYLIDQSKCTNNVVQIEITKTSQTVSNINRTRTTIQSSSKPNQIFTDTCEAYNEGYNPKRCPTYARYCCGSCSNRYCCDNAKDRINQFECRLLSNSTSSGSKNNSNSYLYVILTLVLVLILAFACIPFVIYINKRSKKVNNPNPNMPFQNLVPLALLQQLNTSAATVAETPKVSTNAQREDSPPAYSSIFN